MKKVFIHSKSFTSEIEALAKRYNNVLAVKGCEDFANLLGQFYRATGKELLFIEGSRNLISAVKAYEKRNNKQVYGGVTLIIDKMVALQRDFEIGDMSVEQFEAQKGVEKLNFDEFVYKNIHRYKFTLNESKNGADFQFDAYSMLDTFDIWSVVRDDMKKFTLDLAEGEISVVEIELLLLKNGFLLKEQSRSGDGIYVVNYANKIGRMLRNFNVEPKRNKKGERLGYFNFEDFDCVGGRSKPLANKGQPHLAAYTMLILKVAEHISEFHTEVFSEYDGDMEAYEQASLEAVETVEYSNGDTGCIFENGRLTRYLGFERTELFSRLIDSNITVEDVYAAEQLMDLSQGIGYGDVNLERVSEDLARRCAVYAKILSLIAYRLSWYTTSVEYYDFKSVAIMVVADALTDYLSKEEENANLTESERNIDKIYENQQLKVKVAQKRGDFRCL